MRRVLGLSLLTVLCAACEGASQPDSTDATDGSSAVAAITPSSTQWESFAEQFVTKSLALMPHLAVSRGLHEYDGVQTDYSASAIAARIEHFTDAIQRAQAFTDLTAAQRYDRDLLVWFARRALFGLQDERSHQRSISSYFGAVSPDIYVSREYAPLAARLQALIKHTRGLPNLLSQMRSNLQTPLPAPHIDRALGYFGGLVGFYEDIIPEVFAAVDDARAHAQLDEASLAAVHALRNTLVWLQDQQAQATDSFRLGRALFEQRLRIVEGVDLDAAAFKAKGEADLARNLRALRAACDDIDPAADLTSCVGQVAAIKPEGGAVSGARAQLASIRAFMLEQNLVGVPSDDEARVAAAPPHRRGNSAYISLRGPFEGPEVPSTYYIAPPDPSWTAAERAAYVPGKAGLLFTSIHEVWPGHFLHNLYITSAPSMARRVLRSGGFMEGWAHYTEELMIEAGIGTDDPTLRVGQITQALLRNVRYLCSVGMHVENMAQSECEAMFRDKSFRDPGNARQQAARGTYDPGYYSYTLHKLLIRDLREQWTASRGGRKAWRAFHDALLALGAPPTGLAARHLNGS